VDDRSPGVGPALDPSRILLQWESRSYGGLGYDLRYDRSGPSYRPDVGFELRRDYFRLGDRIGYGWLPGADSPLERHRVSLVGSAYYRNADGSVETAEIGPEWEIFPKGGGSFTVGFRHWIEDLRTPFPLGGEVIVPEGRHTFQTGEVRMTMPGSHRLRTSLTLRAGSFYDGRMASFQVTPTWNASRHLRLSGMYELGRVAFPERSQAVNAHVGRIRAEAAPNVRYSALAFLQYSSLGNVVVGNLRLRYNPREGNDLYLVFNEHLNTHRALGYPRLPLSDSRTVMLKYTHTFGM